MPRTKTKVVKDGLEIELPSTDRCWNFYINHSCGCPVVEHNNCGMHSGRKVVKVKKDGHSGSCTLKRCLVGWDTHSLPEKCRRCERVDTDRILAGGS